MIDMSESKEILKKIKDFNKKSFKDMSPEEVSEFNTEILSNPLVNSIVRINLMTVPNYSPYCGSVECRVVPRTNYKGGQFHCPCCSWVSKFPDDFMALYHGHWCPDQ